MFSVIIPAYNCRNTIVDTLNSIKSQTALELIKEIIIINDGSTDDTEKIVKKYMQDNKQLNIRLISQKNHGVSHARNCGITQSSQDWIALLDADDTWKPKKIEIQYKALLNNPFIYFLGTNRNNENIKIGKLIDDDLKIRKINVKQLLFKTWPSVPTVIFKKDFFSELGGFNCDMKHGEDVDLWLRVARNKQLYYLEGCLTETGFGKRSFGESGLSSNLDAMHFGVISIINKAFLNRDINIIWKYTFISYEYVKFIRRKLITLWRKKC